MRISPPRHLSDLKKSHQTNSRNKEINEAFPLETLGSIALQDQTLVILKAAHGTHWWVDTMVPITQQERSSIQDSIGPPSTRMPMTLSHVFRLQEGTSNTRWLLTTCPKWVEAKALPTNDARVVCKFLKTLFSRFGAPRAIISDRGTHFCNDQFTKVMLKYGVIIVLPPRYHPQAMSGKLLRSQIVVFKRSFEREPWEKIVPPGRTN
ncbi:reverse transcriptase domain-containing protein [Tanacetum coccineum]|uniref:Reverse transcriptase domain-containing protein n=1 Tax=Tanacetum coccineum TaxID=301880 RepID=A0ABQ4ZV12_9ASTR